MATSEIVAHRCAKEPTLCNPGDVLVVGLDDSPLDEAAAQGIARGASAIITEQLLPLPVPQCIVADSRVAYAELLAALADRPSEQVLSIGVAGDAGKTTTTLLVSMVLRKLGLRVAYNCDLGSSDGIAQEVPRECQNTAERFTQWYTCAADAHCHVAVTEISDEMLKTHQVDGVGLDILILAGRPSENRHATKSAYAEAIARVKSRGVVIVDEDNADAIDAADMAAATTMTYGTSEVADVRGRLLERSPGESTYLFSAGDTSVATHSKLAGDWMLSNHLPAVAVGLLIDQPIHKVVAGLSALDCIPGRMHRVPTVAGPSVIVDAAEEPSQLMGTVNSIRKEMDGGQLWCVVPCRTDLTDRESANLGHVAERSADKLILTSDHQGPDQFLPHVHRVMDGITHAQRPQLIARRELAIRWAIEKASPGDTVLILGTWEQDSPRAQRAAIAADVQCVEETPIHHQREDEPVILPHPALLKSKF